MNGFPGIIGNSSQDGRPGNLNYHGSRGRCINREIYSIGYVLQGVGAGGFLRSFPTQSLWDFKISIVCITVYLSGAFL